LGETFIQVCIPVFFFGALRESIATGTALTHKKNQVDGLGSQQLTITLILRSFC
jgi:hypothetical protein